VPIYFIEDDQGNPQLSEWGEWSRWRRENDKRIAYEVVGQTHVVTNFLGMDEEYDLTAYSQRLPPRDYVPFLYETACFSSLGQNRYRFPTRKAADRGHGIVVAALKEGRAIPYEPHVPGKTYKGIPEEVSLYPNALSNAAERFKRIREEQDEQDRLRREKWAREDAERRKKWEEDSRRALDAEAERTKRIREAEDRWANAGHGGLNTLMRPSSQALNSALSGEVVSVAQKERLNSFGVNALIGDIVTVSQNRLQTGWVILVNKVFVREITNEELGAGPTQAAPEGAGLYSSGADVPPKKDPDREVLADRFSFIEFDDKEKP
jgi:hypothetical protein